VALVGLTQASRLDGQLSRRWSVAGLVGGALLLIGAMTTPAIIDGAPTLFVGIAGFLVWIAFVVRTSVALLRNGEAR
jgi:hypothetical protein